MKTIELNVGTVKINVPDGAEQYIDTIKNNFGLGVQLCVGCDLTCESDCHFCVLGNQIFCEKWINQVQEHKK